MAVVIVGTLDTKGDEVRFIRDLLNERGIKTVVVDAGSVGPPAFAADILRERVFGGVAPSGDRGAAVAAATDQIAAEALDKIKIEYEVLTPVLDPLESLKLETPGVHAPSANIYGNAAATGSSDPLAANPAYGGLLAGSLKNAGAPWPPPPTGSLTFYFDHNLMKDLWIAITWGNGI